MPPPRRCSTESGGCFLLPKPPLVPRSCVFTKSVRAPSSSEQGLQQAAHKGHHNHRSWQSASSPSSCNRGGCFVAEKRQRDEGREMAGSPSFLSSPGGGNTGPGKSWKTHLPWKALPVCSSHRCKSHTPVYRDERHTGNPLLSRLHKGIRCVHSPSLCCHKTWAPGQDCSTWVCSHCMHAWV